MGMKCALIALLALVAIAMAVKVDYTGHIVIRVIPETEEQVKYLHYVKSHSSLDFWRLSGRINQAADLHLSPDSYYDVAHSLTENKMDHQIIIPDLGQLEKEEREAIDLRRAVHSGKAFDFQNYHPYEEIVAYLDDLDNASPIVSNQVAGQTVENRSIIEVTVSGGKPNTSVIFIDCNLHAREWVTTATCLWIINELVNGYGNIQEITSLVDKYEWKFLPLGNPDGYAFTWDTRNGDRLWRKNRAVNIGSDCLGVDVNRNFPIGFGELGSSASPCNEAFHGPKAFSENESIAVRDLIARYKSRVKAALSIHNYSQFWLSPYGYQALLPPKYDEMLRVMKIGVEAIQNTYGTPFNYGNLEAVSSLQSGVTTDFYFVDQNITHSYMLELRDKGFYGYELPPNQIATTATETWNGIKAFVEAI